MKITICYDNTSQYDHLVCDWGFSCIVETAGRTILFDTGGNGKILLENLRRMNIDPASFDDIFISHPDFDHIGGLSHILNENDRAIIHNPQSFRGVRYKNEVKYYGAPAVIYDNIFTTGEQGNREQSMVIVENDTAVVIIGCGHPGLRRILYITRGITGIDQVIIVGGLHDFDELEVLEPIKKVCPTHCTRRASEIKKLYPEKFLEGGVGTVLVF